MTMPPQVSTISAGLLVYRESLLPLSRDQTLPTYLTHRIFEFRGRLPSPLASSQFKSTAFLRAPFVSPIFRARPVPENLFFALPRDIPAIFRVV